MFKRIILLVGVNIGIIIALQLVVRIVEQIFGINVTAYLGGDQSGLVVFAIIFGFGGAFINLAISKWMAKSLYGIQLVDRMVSDHKMRVVRETVTDISHRHHITMPEVGYYESGEMNAFATGPSRNNSLVAVSTGLLHTMDDDEIRGVVGHEMAHVLNGDMVTMTLLQGVLNTFTILIARILGGIIDNFLHNRDEGEHSYGIGYFIIVNILEIILGIFAGLILMAYSRRREYRADEGSAKMLGKEPMIAGLQKLQRLTDHNHVPHDGLATLKIAGGRSAWMERWMSHPPIEKRIENIRQMRI